MNYFTKEELQIILISLKLIKHEFQLDYPHLYNRIEKMIVNFNSNHCQLKKTNFHDHTEQPREMVKCDHLWHSKSDFLPGLTMNKDPHSCAKCGVLFSREIHGSNSNNILTAFNNKPIC